MLPFICYMEGSVLCMENYTVIFVTDQRQQYIGDYLPGRYKESRMDELAALIRGAGQVILPTPVLKIDKLYHIRSVVQENLMLNREEGIVQGLTVFGGKFPEEWKKFFRKYEISFVDFMEEEEVALANAEVTAEAAIAELIFHSRYSIRNEKYIVTGYGRCAKTIAAKIAALGGNVTVLARSVRDRKAAKADGHNASDFSYAPEEAYGTRGIINTVPAPVITESMIREMHKDTVILDIASKPGGTDKKAAEKYHIPVIEALGLPGIYTPKSSAKILADCVIRHTLPEDVRKEEKSWIFQIII